MTKTEFESVDAYITSQPEQAQAVLARVRTALRKALPHAEEVISYQIPTYKVPSGPVIYFAGWKKHWSLYPVTDQLVAAFADEIEPYVVSKGTIRFPLTQPVPVALIARIAKYRANEVAQHEKARPSPKSR